MEDVASVWYVWFSAVDIEGILQKGPTRHAYAWQIGPFWQDTLDIWSIIKQDKSKMMFILFWHA